MNKLAIGLSTIFAGYAVNVLAALPTGVSSRGDITAPNYCGGFTFGLTGLYWRASSPELDFSAGFPSIASFLIEPRNLSSGTFSANSDQIKHDYNWAWRANIGYLFPCSGNDINLTYTHYDHDRRKVSRDFDFRTFLPFSEITIAPSFFEFPIDAIQVQGAGIDTADNLVIFSGLFTPPANYAPTSLILTIDPDDITQVAARSNFENNTWDLDFGQTINVGCNFRLHWFGGLRYTRLKQNLEVITDAVGTLALPGGSDEFILATGGLFTATIGNTASVVLGTALVTFEVDTLVRDIVNQKSDFNGIGPRFGLTGDYHLGGGFGLMGSLSTSLLVGNIESRVHTRFEVTPETLSPSNDAIEGSATVHIDDTGGTPEGTLIDETATAIGFGDFDTRFVESALNHPDETRVVPNIDAKIGLDWTYQFCNCSHSKLTIEAGYLVSHYFNAVDRLSAIEAVAPEFRSRHTVDVNFEGPYIGVQVTL